MSIANLDQFPFFLQAYDNLQDHLNSQLDGLNPKEKGDMFVDITTKLIPLTEIGIRTQFEKIERCQHSYDDGVDIICRNAEGTKVLYVQCKLSMKGVEAFDSVISKFNNYLKKHHSSSQGLLPLVEMLDREDKKKFPDISFMIVTLSKLENILTIYRQSHLPSKTFYEELKENDQFIYLDGPRILPLLQVAYRKMHILPTNVLIHLDTPPIQKGSVYLGIISATELKCCHDTFGDALFLENIRSFLGATSGKKKVDPNRENVNEAILETAQNVPEQMLARNNGITFRARKIHKVEDNILQLEEASIVNGCQTTMCLIQAPSPEAFVLVKIVESPDAWNIAKTANFQNRIEQIELLLANYIRPQLLQSIGTKAEVHVHQGTYTSLFDVFSAIYREQIAYDEIYSLFIGFFSKDMNNVINTNYTELRDDLLRTLQSQDGPREDTFYTLFELYRAANDGRRLVEETYTDESYRSIFKRFWEENKPNYRSILTILTACIFVDTNIYDKYIDPEGFRNFLLTLRLALATDRNKFVRYYQYTFETIAISLIDTEKDKNEILRTMYDSLRKAKFNNLYKKVRLFVDGREKERQQH